MHSSIVAAATAAAIGVGGRDDRRSERTVGATRASAVTTTGVASSAITSSGRSGRICFQPHSATDHDDVRAADLDVGERHVQILRQFLRGHRIPFDGQRSSGRASIRESATGGSGP